MGRIEPIVEKRFEYRGFPCVVLFMAGCYRCGYVGLPKSNRYYKKGYDDIPVDCHGGLTFDGELPDYYKPKADYYIGFDCGHYCDGVDYDQAVKYNLITQSEADRNKELFSYLDDRPVRDLDYVEANCKKIVDQLEKTK